MADRNGTIKRASEWQLFGISYFAYASIYIARLNLTVASPVMKAENILTASQVGAMGGGFFLFYAIGQLLNGYLGDLASPRKMVQYGLFLTAATNLGIGCLPGAGAVVCLWGVNGFAQSMLWGPILRTIAGRFPPEKKSVIASYLVSAVGTGSVLGVFLATLAIWGMGIQYAFVVPGIIALVAGIVVAVCYPDIAGDRKRPLQSAGVLRSPKLWILLVPTMLHGVLKDNLNLWAASYIMDVYSVDLVKMSFFIFVIPFLGLAGRLVYPFLLKLYKGREHMVSACGMAVCAICMVPLGFFRIPMVAAAFCMSLASAAISVVNTSFLTVFPTRFQKKGSVSSVAGIMDFATYLGAGISSVLYGLLLEKNTYDSMFSSWLVLAAVATIVLSLYEKKEKNSERKSNIDFN